MKPRYYMITNAGTMIHSTELRNYPYHLVLAQMCLANPLYMNMAKELCMRRGHYVILDNGAHEGQLVGDDDYIDVIREIMPHVAVMPDLIGEHSAASRDRSLEFATRMFSAFGSKVKGMFAGQGSSPEDVINGYEWAYQNLDPSWFAIGFGQSYLQFERPADGFVDEMARSALLLRLRDRLGFKTPEHTGHILGARWVPDSNTSGLVDSYAGLNICGLDTIKPCKCALDKTLYPVRLPGKIDRDSMQSADERVVLLNAASLADVYDLDNQFLLRSYLELERQRLLHMPAVSGDRHPESQGL